MTIPKIDFNQTSQNRCRKSSSRVQKIELPQSQLAQEEMRSNLERTARGRKRGEILQSEGEQQSEISLAEESHNIAIVLSSNHQLKIPEHTPNRN